MSDATAMTLDSTTTVSEILIARHSFLVRAQSLPTGFNQRPGVTLLLSRDAPLNVEIQGRGVMTGNAFLLIPELKRRFVGRQPHYSITIEPGHLDYGRWLAWARTVPANAGFPDVAAGHRQLLEALHTEGEFDAWLGALLDLHQRPPERGDERLLALLALMDGSSDEVTAESIWRQFRERYPGSQAHYSHWLQERLGVSLRKMLLWRKLRKAMCAVLSEDNVTHTAHEAGFADSAHLSRICSRTFGLRPSDANNRKILQVRLLPATGQ